MMLHPSANVIGGEISDLDLSSPLDANTFREFKAAFYQRSVLVFRNQTLGGEDLLGFARQFGEPDQHFLAHYAHPAHPKILLLSNIEAKAKKIGFADAGRVWHSDGSYMQDPVAITMLYALEVPEQDGQTLGSTQFASAWRAYDTLAPSVQRRIAGLLAVHQVGGRRRQLNTGEASDRAQEDAQPPAHHPLVRVHPYTGRRYLYVSKGECEQIVGMQDAEALALIDELAQSIHADANRHVHSWRPGDLLIWDNQALQHLATFDYTWPQHRRLMHRVTIPESAIRADSR